MKSFNHFLREIGVPNDLRSLLYHIARAGKYINFSIRATNTGKEGTRNVFGEEQAALDVMSDRIIAQELEKSELVSRIVSEEQEKPMEVQAPRGNYLVAYDPLDGSSLIDVNFAIGSIFGIWDRPDVLGQKAGENLIASCYFVYGPRVTFMIAVKGLGAHEFELNDVGEFILSDENVRIKSSYKHFAPGNLRCCTENPNYKALLDHWIMGGKKLRYSGGMVPDINHIFNKGEGIFSYPRDKDHPNGKLRLLFECSPFSFIARECGGLSKNQEGQEVLDTIVNEYHQCSPIFVGSNEAVAEAISFMNRP